MPLLPETQLYINASPFWTNSEKESKEDFAKKWERFDNLPENIKEIMESMKTSEIIRDIIINKAGLSEEEVKIMALIIRKICFGDISFSLLKSAMVKFLKISEEMAAEFSFELTGKLFSGNTVIQLRKIEERAKSAQTQKNSEQKNAKVEMAAIPSVQLAEKSVPQKSFQKPKTIISSNIETATIPKAQLPEKASEDAQQEIVSPPKRHVRHSPVSAQLRHSALKENQPQIEQSKREIPTLTPEQIAAGIFPKIQSRTVNLKNGAADIPKYPKENIVNLKE